MTRRYRRMMRSRDRCVTRSCGSTSLVAGRYVVHRCTSQDIRRSRFLIFDRRDDCYPSLERRTIVRWEGWFGFSGVPERGRTTYRFARRTINGSLGDITDRSTNSKQVGWAIRYVRSRRYDGPSSYRLPPKGGRRSMWYYVRMVKMLVGRR